MEPIAIIGSGCRFPGSASSPSRLWELLHNPKDVVSKPPIKRFNIDSFYHRDGTHHGTTNHRESYYLEEDVAVFDAPFFNISPSEAECMDPQQRLLLETVYEAIERAGLRLDLLQGSSTGVFCGYMNHDWGNIMSADMEAVPALSVPGMASSILSNRVSFFFDWNGPSMTIDTACSGSLVAFHQAVEALQKGDCSLAVAAGSNLILIPDSSIAESTMHMLSPTSRSYMWDDRADGYARGEGVAAVLLKRLSDAVRDGDKIECLVRATGVNSDGRTIGLTMPSNVAQQKLIRDTYARAGLNPDDPKDRCQYLEAHGTGTPAGDPQEAQAIYDAFFQNAAAPVASDSEDVLYVGSIKTVIGHTEAASGIASIIKASLALQNGVIPPNLNFRRFNPEVAPFSSHLRVPVSPLPWPEIPHGTPRRVSVNSFGFGGTNAHAILESFDASVPSNSSVSAFPVIVLPFVFSAASAKTLGFVLEQYRQYLQANPRVDLPDLAFSLMAKRSAFSHRLILTATSAEELCQKIQEELKNREANCPSTVEWRPRHGPKNKKIIGVFTGQGAQWPQMCLDLIETSPKAKSWLDELQKSLEELPGEWRPDFSLFNELSKPEATSRLNTSIISLTLRTALQIIQVKLLRTLGVEFAAVVGHSSGEIAAAYAAGVLSASDAIRTAYLRGVATQRAGSNGKPGGGGMMAVAISWEQAHALCDEAPYSGNVTIAAVNSPSSVTLSGDSDLLQELEWVLKSLDHSVKRLRVDTAYHSHHMEPCAEPYVQSLKACGIQTKAPSTSTKWFSSVFDGQQIEHTDALRAEYWKDNMLRPVLFSRAFEAAMEHIPDVDLLVEVGPHSALKGPAMQTISNMTRPGDADADFPYIGVSDRGTTSIDALAIAVGSFWMYLGPGKVDFNQYIRLFDQSKELAFVEDLPTYPFDHTNPYWYESRLSRARLHRPAPNALLGAISAETGQGEYRWRNYMRKDELEWLEGHQIQSQVVFPATGYMAMALEAAAIIVGEQQPFGLLEILDLNIDRAITIPDGWKGIETLFKVELTHIGKKIIEATFICQAECDDTLTTCASGAMVITLGKQDPTLLPERHATNARLQPVNMEAFYWKLAELGYGYSGLFKTLTDLTRQRNMAQGTIQVFDQLKSEPPLLIHPATIDAALHSLFAAIGSPEDGQLTELHVPTRIERTIINPAFCRSGTMAIQKDLAVQAELTNHGASGTTGAIDIFDASGRGVIQIEGIHIFPLTRSLDHPCPIMSEVNWGVLQPDASLATSMGTPDFLTYAAVGEPLAMQYLRDASKQLTVADREKLDWHRSRYVAWMDRVLSMARESTTTQPLYALESSDDILATENKSLYEVEMLVLHAVGKALPAFFRGETTIMETLREGNLLTRSYNEFRDIGLMTRNLATLVGQIAFRFPRMKILEVGAGTGSATREVLKQIGRAYHSYTYTDISAAFFEDAREVFSEHEDRFVYEVLNLDDDPVEQGFTMNEYDLVIASNVLHATKSLKGTLSNIKKLLKPGGRLAAFETTDPHNILFTFIYGGFEGWWHGEKDGRAWGPLVDCEEWNRLLKSTGFDGFETISPEEESKLFGQSVFVSQAVDHNMQLLKSPFSMPSGGPTRDLFLVGGSTEITRRLVPPLKDLLKQYFRRVYDVPTLDGFAPPEGSSLAAVLMLSDMDSPCLQDLTDGRLKGLQNMLNVAGKLLWVSTGYDSKGLHASMSKGLFRSLVFEYPHSLMQHLTIADPKAARAELLAETLMRLVHTNFDNDVKLPTCVQNTETELLLEDGVMKIPRVRTSAPMNQRLLASRTVVEERTDTQETRIGVVPASSNSSYSLLSLPKPQQRNEGGRSSIDVRVHYSTLSAVPCDGIGWLHLVVGEDSRTQARKLALSVEHASQISTPASWSLDIPSELPKEDEPAYLKDVAAALLATYLVNKTRAGTTLLVHEPDAVSCILRSALSALGSLRGVRTRFTTCNASLKQDRATTLCIHPRSTSRMISSILPVDVTVFARFSNNFPNVTSLEKGVVKYDVDSMFQASAYVEKNSDIDTAASTLATASLFAFQKDGQRKAVTTIKLDTLPEHTMGARLEIVDWTGPTKVKAQIQPASSHIALSPSKTYLLVGMTGDLGLSVCRWMVTRGARNIVLTSRTPKIDPQWINEMSSLGARVLPMSM